jgi:phage-related protein
MIKDFVAHIGSEITIEWYFTTQNESPAIDYFEKLPANRKKKVVHLWYLLGEGVTRLNKEKFRHEGHQVYAIKVDQDRFLCFFFAGSKIIMTNAYEKKSAKMPQREKIKALNAKNDYTQRCKEGTYYE